MAAANNSVPIISVKITGLVDNLILEKLNKGAVLTEGENREYQQLKDRLDTLCEKAYELGVGVFIDAEESWIQKPIDDLTKEMMMQYNNEKCIVFNTYQLYRHDKLQQLKDDHAWALSEDIILGAKLVRGAYMEKERERAILLQFNQIKKPLIEILMLL